ncbi:MAG: antibiotic biosynthesis monooxygenase family protein [Bacteroidia bacterium]
MIIRIVKMTFQPEKVKAFQEIFDNSQALILAMRGCQHLELWRQTASGNILFTYSHWNSEADLDHYRYSELFKTTWARTKVLFSAKAEAWSVEQVTTAGEPDTE